MPEFRLRLRTTVQNENLKGTREKRKFANRGEELIVNLW